MRQALGWGAGALEMVNFCATWLMSRRNVFVKMFVSRENPKEFQSLLAPTFEYIYIYLYIYIYHVFQLKNI